MKILDISVNVIIVLAITLFASYVTYYYYDGFGLLESLPEGVTSFFIENGAIQYVALAMLVAAVVGKFVIERVTRRRQPRN